MDIHILHKSQDIPSEPWSRLAAHIYQSPEWCLANERYLPQSRFFYFVCRDQGILKAIQPAYIGHDPYYAGPDQVFFRGLKVFARGLKYLVAGSPLAFASDVIGEPSALAHILPEMEKAALQNGCDAVVFPHLRSRIQAAGGRLRRSMTDYDLSLPGTSFEDYLKLFSSQRRRTAVRRELKAADDITFVQTPIEGHEDAILDFVQAKARKNRNAAALNARLYTCLAECLKEHAELIWAQKEGKKVGCQVYFTYKDTLSCFHAGNDDIKMLHFNVVYYEPIKLAYKLGIRHLNFRPSSDAVKLARKCRAVDKYAYLKPLTTKAKFLTSFLGSILDRIESVSANPSVTESED